MDNVKASVHDGVVDLVDVVSGEVLQTMPAIPAQEQHRNFIISTWVNSYLKDGKSLRIMSPYYGMPLDMDAYRSGESSLAERKWKLSKVVVSKDDEYTVHAWCCTNGEPGGRGVLFHVYVPPDLRGLGIAKGLVQAEIGTRYKTHKPWPRVPFGHKVSWSPYV